MITNDTISKGRLVHRCLPGILFCFLTLGFPMTSDANADDKTDMIQLADSDLDDKAPYSATNDG